MQVKEKLWRETSIKNMLDIFNGKVAEKLIGRDAKIIENFRKHIYHVFRRWYFLSLTPNDEPSPADRLEYYRKIEKWPKNGQFFVRPDLRQQGQEIILELDVDYISFMEMPLLVDIRKKLMGKKGELNFKNDEVYQDLVERASENMRILNVKTLSSKKFTSQELHSIWKALIMTISSMWMEFDPFIGQAFTLGGFTKLWEKFMRDGLKDEVAIDDIFDEIITIVRKKYSFWGYTVKELEEKEINKESLDKRRVKAFCDLGLCLDRYFLTPFSMYLPLIISHYFDHSCWERDFMDALSSSKADIAYIFSDPCSAFVLTGFGEKLVKEAII